MNMWTQLWIVFQSQVSVVSSVKEAANVEDDEDPQETAELMEKGKCLLADVNIVNWN